MKTISLVFVAIMAANFVYGQSLPQTAELAQLRKSPPYDSLQKQTYPAFNYQSPDDPDLTSLRTTYHLDSVAGSGTETERAIRLLEWFHNQVPHEDELNISILNARSIIDNYREKKMGQGCYPLSIGMNEVFLSMGFKSRSVICFSDRYPAPRGGHVINAVYITSLNKWIYMDPQDNAYIKDEKGNFLSIEEVRQRLISGRPLVLNKTANYHQVPVTKEEYLYEFMAEHLYRMICPVNSEFNSQTRLQGKLQQYVELLPVGSKDPAIDMFETSNRDGYQVITYHTNNSKLFWQKP